jgi:TetR/AcrR family transcriptional regulator
MSNHPPARVQQERSDQTRARILEAATQAFSDEGLAGARTEQIAKAAGVNKALIYYYFRSKDELYDAVVDAAAEQVVATSMAMLNAGASAGERVVQFALNHFDRIHSQHTFQGLMHQEMMRMHRGEKNALSTIVEKVFRPTTERFLELVAEGQQSGELIAIDSWQLMNAALGANTFYFLSMPVVKLLTRKELFSEEELKRRRRAAVEYLGMTIFADRAAGVRAAERVLEATPMPPSVNYDQWRRHRGLHRDFEVKK